MFYDEAHMSVAVLSFPLTRSSGQNTTDTERLPHCVSFPFFQATVLPTFSAIIIKVDIAGSSQSVFCQIAH